MRLRSVGARSARLDESRGPQAANRPKSFGPEGYTHFGADGNVYLNPLYRPKLPAKTVKPPAKSHVLTLQRPPGANPYNKGGSDGAKIVGLNPAALAGITSKSLLFLLTGENPAPAPAQSPSNYPSEDAAAQAHPSGLFRYANRDTPNVSYSGGTHLTYYGPMTRTNNPNLSTAGRFLALPGGPKTFRVNMSDNLADYAFFWTNNVGPRLFSPPSVYVEFWEHSFTLSKPGEGDPNLHPTFTTWWNAQEPNPMPTPVPGVVMAVDFHAQRSGSVVEFPFVKFRDLRKLKSLAPIRIEIHNPVPRPARPVLSKLLGGKGPPGVTATVTQGGARRPPDRFTKEKKTRAQKVVLFALLVAFETTELLDLVDALYDALPALRKVSKYRPHPHCIAEEKINALIDHFDEINAADALMGVYANYIEDKVIGGLSKNAGASLKQLTGKNVSGIAL